MAKSIKKTSKILLSVCSVLLTLLFCEITSRHIYPTSVAHFVGCDGKSVDMDLPDPQLEFRLKPNFCGKQVATEFQVSVRTNSSGFRNNQEFRREKPPGTFRILGLGDSFTFGWGVEENQTYLSVLARKLERRFNRNVEVFNLGVWNYGTLQELKVFHQFESYQPDLITLEFYARNAFVNEFANDLVDNYYFDFWSKSRQTSAMSLPLPISRRTGRFLLAHSNLFRIGALELGSIVKRLYQPTGDQEMLAAAWRITDDALHTFDRDLQSMNQKCVLIWAAPPGTIHAKDPSVFRHLASLGLRNVILVSTMEEMGNGVQNYYYHMDNHWNAMGQQAVANVLFQSIVRQGLIRPLEPIRTDTADPAANPSSHAGDRVGSNS